MEYRIVLEPELGMNAAEFIEEWNAGDDSRALAEAQAASGSLESFPFDPGMVREILLVGAAFAGGIAADTLKDIVKERVKKWIDKKFPTAPKPEIDVTILDQHGQPLVVVKKQE